MGHRVVFLQRTSRLGVRLLTGRQRRQTPEDGFSGTDAAKSDFAKRSKWEHGGHATETAFALVTRHGVLAKRVTERLEVPVRPRNCTAASVAADEVPAAAEMEHCLHNFTVPKEGHKADGQRGPPSHSPVSEDATRLSKIKAAVRQAVANSRAHYFEVGRAATRGGGAQLWGRARSKAVSRRGQGLIFVVNCGRRLRGPISYRGRVTCPTPKSQRPLGRSAPP